MSDTSGIEWTDATWNPVRGCSIVSKGCTNCYAMKQAHRFSAPGQAYAGLTKLTKGGPVWTGEVAMVPGMLTWPITKKKPARIFVNSMSDLFHESVPFAFIDQVFAVMRRARDHTFQVLTKRPQRMLDYLCAHDLAERIFIAGHHTPFCATDSPPHMPLRNVWLGVSVEDQAAADERIPLLLQTPAAVRWISAEPLLGPIDLYKPHAHWATDPTNERTDLDLLNWVVVGGESGWGRARPMHPEWARSIRDQCEQLKIPFFFKQWGEWAPPGIFPKELWRPGHTYVNCEVYGDEYVMAVGKKTAGRQLDGREWNEYPA